MVYYYGMNEITGLIIVFGCILVSMTLHEAMHAYVGYWLGDDTAEKQGRLTLNPLAHIDPIMTVVLPLMLFLSGLPPFGAAKPVPINTARLKYGDFGSAIVGAAGPLTNLALAVLAGAVIRLFPGLDGSVMNILYLFVLVNASFFLFNIIPFPPLDGSRILYAVAPAPVQRVMERVESFGVLAIFAFFLLFSLFFTDAFSRVLSALLTLLLGGKAAV